jgi:hypothetical protein
MPPDAKPKPLPSRSCTLRIADLVRDDRLRFRDAAYRAIAPVHEYADAMRGDPDEDGYAGPSWGAFPRLVCIDLTEPFTWSQELPAKGSLDKPKKETQTYPAGTTILIGGFTRCDAADESGVARAPAVVYSGTWADAMRLAWGENTARQHGMKRSASETEMVLFSIHMEHPQLSEREAAALAGCSQKTVNRYRNEVEAKAAEFAEATRRAEAFAAATRSGSPPPPPPPPAAPASPPPPATPSHEPAGVVPVDAWKRPLPVGLVGPFEAVGPAQKLLRSLRSDAKALFQQKHGADGTEKCLAPGLVRADVMGVLAAVAAAADMVEADLPFLVCPECDGAGKANGKACKLCKGLGWVAKAEADRFTPAQEKAAGKFRGAN